MSARTSEIRKPRNGLYLNPPEQALVLCVDEKSNARRWSVRSRWLPLGPGRPERATHDYFRHGTVSLFAALDVQTGKIIGQCQARHMQRQFLEFLKRIDAATPPTSTRAAAASCSIP